MQKITPNNYPILYDLIESYLLKLIPYPVNEKTKIEIIMTSEIKASISYTKEGNLITFYLKPDMLVAIVSLALFEQQISLPSLELGICTTRSRKVGEEELLSNLEEILREITIIGNKLEIKKDYFRKSSQSSSSFSES